MNPCKWYVHEYGDNISDVTCSGLKESLKHGGSKEKQIQWVGFFFSFSIEIQVFLLKKPYILLLVSSEPLLWHLCPHRGHIPYMISTKLILYLTYTCVLLHTGSQDIWDWRDLWRWYTATHCSQLGQLWHPSKFLKALSSQSWKLQGWRLQHLPAQLHTAWLSLWLKNLFFIFTLNLSFQFMPNIFHPPTGTMLGIVCLHLLNELLVGAGRPLKATLKAISCPGWTSPGRSASLRASSPYLQPCWWPLLNSL